MADFYIRQGDTASPLSDTLKDADGNPVDLNGATIQVTLLPAAGGNALINAAAANDQIGDGSDGSKGKVSYVWQAGDTDTPGLYLGAWTVTFTDGSVQTFPNGSYLLINITADAPVTAATRFATAVDLAERLGIDLTADDTIRANHLLAAATGLIQDVARQTISLVTDETLTMPGINRDRVTLPQRPVVSVASVTLDGSALGEGVDWYLDGDELVRLAPVALGRLGIVDGLGSGFGRPWQTLAVTYTHGYADVDLPQLVKSICVEAVARVWTNPGALISERVGDTEVTFAAYAEPASGLLLTSNERRQLRRFFGVRGAAIRVG